MTEIDGVSAVMPEPQESTPSASAALASQSRSNATESSPNPFFIPTSNDRTVTGEQVTAETLPANAQTLRAQQFESLKDLSFVAVVTGSGNVWNSKKCRRDLHAVARVAPGLERLALRNPKISVGRMTRRPGQAIEVLARISRQFCATYPEELLGVGKLLPSLRQLDVEVMKDMPPFDQSFTSALRSSGLAEVMDEALSVHDRPFHLRVGACPTWAWLLHRAVAEAEAKRGQTSLTLEILGECPAFEAPVTVLVAGADRFLEANSTTDPPV
ncbi:unnamed protein product [Polarella glacialis]|uniref:Uncharacterized protein n=1 Tax=Polarella glacialis TaxID=89957 RepID=A0A813HL02_POLGL|nr:unnamed protein product [Polarella glacialis]